MIDVRNDCLNLIIEILENRRPSHLVIAEYLNSHRDLEGTDRAFVSRLVRGTVERRITLDYVIEQKSSTKVHKMKPVIRNILRMGVYQLVYMNVPDSAACNESVKLAKKRGFANLTGFVNANLRGIARLKDEIGGQDFVGSLLKAAGGLDRTKLMSVRYSLPEWIVEYFLCEYGEESAKAAFSYYLEDNGTTICTVTSKIQPEELKKRLETRGVNVTATGVEGSFSISGFGSLESLPEFKEGLFFVQAVSSTMAVNQAEFHKNDKVLDLCAAPGGKTMHAADLLNNLGAGSTVISCDISERKTALISENVNRCGFSNINAVVNDATVLRQDFVDSFDVVLCDVPCSGLGIIGRKPDIKYNMTPEGQQELVKLQRQILDNAIRYVKADGQLIFSTCTVNKAENQENVDYIKSLGLKCISSRQILPGEEKTDGFFFAKFTRQ